MKIRFNELGNISRTGLYHFLWVLFVLLITAAGACSGDETMREAEPRHSRLSNFDDVLAFDRQFDDLFEREALRRAQSQAIDATIDLKAIEGAPIQHREVLDRLYKAHSYRPIWHGGFADEYRPIDAVSELREGLGDAVRSHGMWPAQVHLSRLREFETDRECCLYGEDLGLTRDQREAILEYLQKKQIKLDAASDLDWLVRRVVNSEGPTPELAREMDERLTMLEGRTRTLARQDILLTDALVEYLTSMRYENPVWHQPRAWRATLRTGDRGPVRSSTIAGEEKEKTAASGMRRAIEKARKYALTLETLEGIVDKPGTVGEVMDEVTPPYEAYRRLAGAFRRYRPIVEQGGWPELSETGRGLSLGDVSRDVRTLKERLRIEGYWSPANGEDQSPTAPSEEGAEAASGSYVAAAVAGDVVDASVEAAPRVLELRPTDEYDMVFDASVKEAVIAYQRTHQLRDNGQVTPETWRSLNVPARRRWNQIRVSLQRWRESNIGADDHYIHVNIPDFHAEVWRDGERKMRFRVVTGQGVRKEDKKTGAVRYPRATPRFSDRLEYMVLNPYWNVPESIRRNELKPKLEENPDYYEENGFEVVVDDNGYEFLRQKPGPKNALGKVKFLFPNEHSVYMHDTTEKQLFDKPTRAYSHGCVRIEHPKKLMHYLLDLDGRWSGKEREKHLKRWFSQENEKWLGLQTTVPVHIEYYVVRVDDQGHTNFLADVYDLDEPRMTAVDERLQTHPDGYDLPRPGQTELMGAALSGTLEPAPGL